jgi:hypothetical protein
MPKKESEVQTRFKNLMNEALLNPPDKVFLDSIPLKYKWRIILRHEEVLQDYLSLGNEKSSRLQGCFHNLR